MIPVEKQEMGFSHVALAFSAEQRPELHLPLDSAARRLKDLPLEFDAWRWRKPGMKNGEIGEIVKQVYRDVTGLVSVLNSIPKSVWREEHSKAADAMSELRHVLEERLANEHPEKWDTDVFYGTGDLNKSWQ